MGNLPGQIEEHILSFDQRAHGVRIAHISHIDPQPVLIAGDVKEIAPVVRDQRVDKRDLRAEIDETLARLPGWHRVGALIRCRYRFAEFAGAVRFTVQMAEVADQIDHHPEWTVRYREVDVESWTHDSGGLTSLDLTLARKLSELANASGAESIATDVD